ncbi:hypothetical protein BDV98DRAFT_548839 [Pterulicium gracile]|uniref:Asl1-like glycosyl hydrolase catalytic domain-containing protein n=1 Tax=Pterulicium gracile TaxID=1884261 RepID=A0A5C3QIH5_9AGAR|nr:hypothetical protein BDV98DRAFT_548839 [Pterula gracilis]
MRLSALASLALATLASAQSKRGLAYPWCTSLFNENTNIDPGRFTNGGKVQWMYNWETWRPARTPAVNFIGTQAKLDSPSSPIWDLHNRWRQQGWTDVFHLNEPDLNNISPQQAVDHYLQHINPMTIRKGFPSVTSSSNGNMGLNWLQNFINICGGRCYHDYLNLHWYGSNFGQFQNHIREANRRWPNERIVISEFSLEQPANGNQQRDFFAQAIPWLDSQPYVIMYFPFVATSPDLLSRNDGAAVGHVGTGGTLFNNDGSPSAIGQLMLR